MADSVAAVPEPVVLAKRLAAAVADRAPIPPLTESDPTFDAAAAYRVQQEGIRERLAAGERVIGYKLGLVSRAKQGAMGVSQPLWGVVTDGMVQSEEIPLDLTTLIHPRAEPEIAFLLGRAVDGPTATVATVLAATEGVLPAIEVLDSRYLDFRFALPDVIADNASAARILIGEGMVLRLNGEVVDTAAGAAIAGHPAAAVAWLARQVGHLPAGSMVLSGGLTAPVELVPGAVVTAEYTSLGVVTLRCSR